MHEARFNSKKKTSLSLLKASSSSLPTINENSGNKGSDSNNEVKEIGNLLKSRLNLAAAAASSSSNQENNNEIEDKKNPIMILAQSKAHDLVSTLSLDDDAELKLKRLQEILKPYIENKVDVRASFFSYLHSFMLFLPFFFRLNLLMILKQFDENKNVVFNYYTVILLLYNNQLNRNNKLQQIKFIII
jgi:hypothetical protein